MQIVTGNFKVTSQPAAEPVSLAEAKLHLKVDNSADDTLISALITAARQHLERHCNSAFVTQTITEVWPSFYKRNHCSVAPVQSLTTLQHISEGAAIYTTTDASLYGFDTYAKPAYIYRMPDMTYPITEDVPDAVKAVYVAGYGAAASVPVPIKAAILLVVADLYENRQDTIKRMPSAAEYLIAPYRYTWY